MIVLLKKIGRGDPDGIETQGPRPRDDLLGQG
jgi:hypothetical protein